MLVRPSERGRILPSSGRPVTSGDFETRRRRNERAPGGRLIAVCITGYHAINLFSDRGVAHEVVEFDANTDDL